MNKVILMGRLTAEPTIRFAVGENGTAVAHYTLAVDRRYNRDQQSADFFRCVSFGKSAEFAEKYLHRGTKIAVTGHLQTGKYTKKDGVITYTTDIIVEEVEFAESKKNSQGGADGNGSSAGNETDDGFMQIPDDIGDELPFT